MSQKKPSQRYITIQPMNVGFPNQIYYSVICQNVSKTGILFIGQQSELPFKVADNCHLSIYQPNLGLERPIELPATIIRIDPPYKANNFGDYRHYGVALNIKEKSNFRLWDSFINSLAKT